LRRVGSVAAAACSMAPRPVWPRRYRPVAKGTRPAGAGVSCQGADDCCEGGRSAFRVDAKRKWNVKRKWL
jgi:hypothetical protein